MWRAFGTLAVLKATSGDAANAVKAAAGTLGRGDPIPWPLWAKLSKSKAPKADTSIFESVARAALAHPGHPALRRDLDRFVRLVFECATDSICASQAYKAERGLLDFTDQETLALDLLRRPETQERLRESIEVVLVDEVQDASPLQVAIFTELARVARRSVWVGDPKQAIYGFRDADPNLTLVAAQASPRSWRIHLPGRFALVRVGRATSGRPTSRCCVATTRTWRISPLRCRPWACPSRSSEATFSRRPRSSSRWRHCAGRPTAATGCPWQRWRAWLAVRSGRPLGSKQ